MGEKQVSTRLIYRKIEGLLSSAEESVFDVWLNENEKHLRYYEKMREEFSGEESRELTEPKLQEAWLEFEARMRERRRVEKKRYFAWGMKVAAALVILFCCCVFLYTREGAVWKVKYDTQIITPERNSPILEMADGSVYYLGGKHYSLREKTGNRIIADSTKLSYALSGSEGQVAGQVVYNKLIVPRGGEYQVELEDGTKVWLNSDSRLRYPVAFAEDKREVYMEGEVFFEVKPDAAKPFIVHAGAQKISVLGTSFGVTCYAGELNDYTTLVSGKVEVHFEKINKSCVLEPGMQVAYNKEKGIATEQEVNVMEYIAWKDGLYVFKQKRLEEILTTLSRWYDFEVSYRNEEVKDVIFSGELKRFADFSYLLNLIERTSNVKFLIHERVVQVMK